MTRLTLALFLVSSAALAQTSPSSPAAPVVVAAAPTSSHGLLVPTLRLGFDSRNAATLSRYAAGPGYAYSWNFAPSADKTVRWLSLGVAGFVTMTPPAEGAGQAFSLSVGGCIGVYNNVVRLCETYDLINAATAGTTGLLAKPTLQNLASVIAIGINFDIGNSNLAPVMQQVGVDAWMRIVPTKQPPAYL
jgi:hypothetical protein